MAKQAPEATPAAGSPDAKEPKKGKPAKESAAPAPAPEAAAPAVPTPGDAAAPAATESAKKKGKQPGNPPRRGKKLRNQLKNITQKVSKTDPMPLRKALAFLKQHKRAKFDETVEVHMSLGIDTTQNDQMVRGSVVLPHGLGKTKRVLVFCQGDNVAKAKEAGADYAGSDELIKKIQTEGWLEFDVALATQDMMGQVSRLGKVLGPRGLMPTPKAGTVIVGDVTNSVREFKAGKVEYRADKGGNVHAGVGKLSFDEGRLADNVQAFIEQIRLVKPSSVRGNYVRSITVSATMSPGVPVTA